MADAVVNPRRPVEAALVALMKRRQLGQPLREACTGAVDDVLEELVGARVVGPLTKKKRVVWPPRRGRGQQRSTSGQSPDVDPEIDHLSRLKKFVGGT